MGLGGSDELLPMPDDGLSALSELPGELAKEGGDDSPILSSGKPIKVLTSPENKSKTNFSYNLIYIISCQY